jgi:hypothetical protein
MHGRVLNFLFPAQQPEHLMAIGVLPDRGWEDPVIRDIINSLVFSPD